MANIINFYCLHCCRDFNLDVGKVRFDPEEDTPTFEKVIKCPTCQAEYSKEKDNFSQHFELTELGQTKLTQLFMKSL
jgi:hypothetical protein